MRVLCSILFGITHLTFHPTAHPTSGSSYLGRILASSGPCSYDVIGYILGAFFFFRREEAGELLILFVLLNIAHPTKHRALSTLALFHLQQNPFICQVPNR